MVWTNGSSVIASSSAAGVSSLLTNGTSPTCEFLRGVTIFSHRGRGLPSGSWTRPYYLSERNLVELARQGIRHFDLDLFWTSEGTMWVGHPDELSHYFARQEKKMTLAGRSVFELGSKEVLTHALDLLSLERLLELATEHRLRLALELKGRSQPFYALKLDLLCEQIRRRVLQRQVCLWVDGSRNAVRLHQMGKAWGLQLIKSVADVGSLQQRQRDGRHLHDCARSFRAASAQRYQLFGPSARCLNELFLERLKSIHAPLPLQLLVWAVDDESDFSRLLKLGARAFVSNTPIELTQKVSALTHRACADEAQALPTRPQLLSQPGSPTSACTASVLC